MAMYTNKRYANSNKSRSKLRAYLSHVMKRGHLISWTLIDTAGYWHSLTLQSSYSSMAKIDWNRLWIDPALIMLCICNLKPLLPPIKGLIPGFIWQNNHSRLVYYGFQGL
jgi:hypothetical protein